MQIPKFIDKGWYRDGVYYATREALEKATNPSQFLILKRCHRCNQHKVLNGGTYRNKKFICKDCK